SGPDLDASHRADHGAVTLQPCVLTQAGRDGDPALLVGNLGAGTGGQHASEVSGALVGERRRPQLLGEPGELSLRPHVQASLLPSCDHHAVPQVFSELRREAYPPLVRQTWGVSAEEHGPPPHLWAPRPGRCPPRTLLSSIGPHSTPHHPTCNHFHTAP